MKPVIVESIVKHYGKKKETEAVKNISFEVNAGELFGLIGPDGAGKTSLFRIMATLLLADSGTAVIDGYDVVRDYKKIRNRLGYMPARFSLYQDLTVEENIHFFATIFNTSIDENYDLIREIYSQIEPFKKRKAGKLSGGMKQKLALSCALIHRPSVLLLDEPTTGVDAVSRKEFWEMLKKLKHQGITILVSTPYMDEASMCDRIALLQEGTLMSMDSPQRITAAFENKIIEARSQNMLGLLNRLKSSALVKDAYAFGEFHHVVLSPAASEQALLNDVKTDFTDTVFRPAEAGIEDCFIALMKK